MRPIGFSTGALAFGDFRRGLKIVRDHGLKVVELSALREPEVDPLMDALDSLDLSGFGYIAVHAPSAMARGQEQHVVDRLLAARDRGWPIILHPDAIHEPSRWTALGDCLCIENMDKRKSTGRSDHELRRWFDHYPHAGFCLDLGHARQCDATMTEAYFLLKRYGGRLRQIHISDVTAASRHDRLSWSSEKAFQQVARYIPEDVPVVIESVIDAAEVGREIERVKRALTAHPAQASVDAQSRELRTT
jgi:sugar phosphate isomerase/epimerase